MSNNDTKLTYGIQSNNPMIAMNSKVLYEVQDNESKINKQQCHVIRNNEQSEKILIISTELTILYTIEKSYIKM